MSTCFINLAPLIKKQPTFYSINDSLLEYSALFKKYFFRVSEDCTLNINCCLRGKNEITLEKILLLDLVRMRSWGKTKHLGDMNFKNNLGLILIKNSNLKINLSWKMLQKPEMNYTF